MTCTDRHNIHVLEYPSTSGLRLRPILYTGYVEYHHMRTVTGTNPSNVAMLPRHNEIKY